MHAYACARVCVETKERERDRERNKKTTKTKRNKQDKKKQKKRGLRGCVTFNPPPPLRLFCFSQNWHAQGCGSVVGVPPRERLSHARAPCSSGWQCVQHSLKSESNMETMSMVEICGTNRIKCGEFTHGPRGRRLLRRALSFPVGNRCRGRVQDINIDSVQDVVRPVNQYEKHSSPYVEVSCSLIFCGGFAAVLPLPMEPAPHAEERDRQEVDASKGECIGASHTPG